MAYQEITSTKTINLEPDSGIITLTYYVGNKEKTTGSIAGNIDKKDITYVFDGTSSWITSVILTRIDDTAKNIKITYQSNTGTSDRQVKLKLKDQTSAYYLILKQYGQSDDAEYGYKVISTNFPNIPVNTFVIATFYEESEGPSFTIVMQHQTSSRWYTYIDDIPTSIDPESDTCNQNALFNRYNAKAMYTVTSAPFRFILDGTSNTYWYDNMLHVYKQSVYYCDGVYKFND